MSQIQVPEAEEYVGEDGEKPVAGGGPVRSFLARRCSLCQKETILDAGDTLCGDKWYHASCWTLVEEALQKG